ncbi:hypothetical protein IR083_16425 [Dysgonomonas sp. GY75]|nr:hypothetical protein [Dysgonomonas sp. GY75]
MNKYANRDKEYYKFTSSIEKNNIIMIKANKACGITSFLKEKIKFHNLNLVIYVDASSSESLTQRVLSVLMKNDLFKEQLQDITNDKLCVINKSPLIQSAIKAIPFAGELASALWSKFVSSFKKKNRLKKILIKYSKEGTSGIYSGDYISVQIEILSLFFEKFTLPNNGKLVLVIDNAQDANEETLDFFSINSKNSNNICSVFVITDNDINKYSKLKNSISLHNQLELDEIEFSIPDINLVIEIGNIFDKKIEENKANIILNQSQYNIHRIIEFIRNENCITLESLSLVEKQILFTLLIYNDQVSKNQIYNIFLRGNIYSEDLNKEIIEKLKILEEKSLIHKIDNVSGELVFYQIIARNNPIIQSLKEQVAELLIIETIILNYLSDKDIDCLNESEILLAYNLTVKHHNSSKEKYARKLLKIYLKNKATIESDIVSNATLQKTNIKDCLIAAIYHCKLGEYSIALMWIEYIPKSKRNFNINKLHSVLLDRTRKLKDAYSLLSNCIDKEKDNKYKSILLSFLAANLLHSNRIDEVKELYNKWDKHLSGCKNYGYFLRTITSAYRNTDELYEKALSNFSLNNDNFGYYTSLCNYGYYLILRDRLDEAFEKLYEAKIGMEKFGIHNCHIVYNDIGIYHLMRGNKDDILRAVQYFNLSISISKNSMPRIFSQINRACCYTFLDEHEKALSAIRDLEKDVTTHTLDRVREQYYANRIFIEYSWGNKNLIELIEKNKCFKNRYNPKLTEERCKFYERAISTEFSYTSGQKRFLYSPCGLVYWFVDPLKLLPESILN